MVYHGVRRMYAAVCRCAPLRVAVRWSTPGEREGARMPGHAARHWGHAARAQESSRRDQESVLRFQKSPGEHFYEVPWCMAGVCRWAPL